MESIDSVLAKVAACPLCQGLRSKRCRDCGPLLDAMFETMRARLNEDAAVKSLSIEPVKKPSILEILKSLVTKKGCLR